MKVFSRDEGIKNNTRATVGQIYYLINCLPPGTGIRNNTHTVMVLDLLFDGPIIWWPHYLGYLLCGAGIKNNTRTTVCQIYYLINCVSPDTGIRNNPHTAMVHDLFFDGPIIWWPHYLGYLLCVAGIKNNTREVFASPKSRVYEIYIWLLSTHHETQVLKIIPVQPRVKSTI